MTLSRIELECNGESVAFEAPGDELLLHAVRDRLGLTAAKLGCGTGDCGSCTVLLDGRAVNSCLIYAAECVGRSLTTTEGLSGDPVGGVVIEELVNRNAVQCGICTPGFVAAATAAIRDAEGALDRGQLAEALAGNLCRCTGYYPILEAVQAASERVAGASA